MSRPLRGQAAATGAIRPPTSGLTLPRGIGSRDFLNDVPEMPPLTQRIQPGSRRATLTAATFSPPNDGYVTFGRSSGLAAGPASFAAGRATSPSPATTRDSQATLALRTPLAHGPRDVGTSDALARARALSPPHAATALLSAAIAGHDTLPKTLALGCGAHLLQRSADGLPSTKRPGSRAAQPVAASPALGSNGPPSTADGCGQAIPRPGSAAGLRCGEAVFIPSQGLRGTLRFLGPIDGKQGTWAGIELDEVGKGKNDGTVSGKSYFVCPPNTGIFAAPSKVEPCMDQRSLSVPPRAGPALSSSLVPGPAETDRSAHSSSRPESTSRLGHSTPASSAHQRPQGKPPGRSRFASDAQSPAGTGLASSSNMSSPVQNRRKTMSRIAPLEQPAGALRPRPPPTTVSKGTGRTRPISTAESVTSNRTTSPSLSLSRPSSRSLISANSDLAAATSNPTRMATLRPHAPGGPPGLDPLSTTVGPPKRRPTATALVRPPDVASRTTDGADKLRGAAVGDSAERLRLRIDMLEAENRVLRLKGEQDKAHLAAGHMLARGLATVNGAASPQTRGGSEGVSRFSPRGPALPPAASESSDTSGLNQQLNDARDLLERERQESKARVALLVSQIRDLKLQGGSDGSIAVASTERAEAQSQTVLADEGSGARIAQLESILEQTTQEYTQELALAKKTQTDLELELEARSSTNRDLQSDLEARSSEVASLDSRLKQADAERLRANDMLKELAQEHEQKQADDSSEKSELASNLNNQVEKLRQGLVASEEQRLGMSSRLDTTQNLLATAETKLTAAQDRLVLLEERVADYDAKSDLAGLYHSRMCLTVEAVQKLAERTCSADAGADEFLPESCSVEAATRLYARLQALVARLDSTASVQPFPKASSEGADADDRVRSEQDAGLLAQIGELEELNNTLVKERDQITHEQTLVNDYLGKLESECNRLVEDIEQLNAENQRLSENLRAASLQNSTISLDIGSLDARLVDEQAGASGSPPRAANPTTSSGVADDTAGALGQQARELAATRAQLAELKQHKDSEIKRLQDELGCLEDLIEDKIFNESELNDKISSLTSEVERLQHKLQRLQGVGEVNAAAATSAGSGPKPEPNGVVTVASSVCDKDVTARTGPSGPQRDALRTEDASDDEPAYCDICDVRSHGIADCPQLNAAPSALFKNEVSIDSSRPYCDNCEAFVDHWTDECPHGDEMF